MEKLELRKIEFEVADIKDFSDELNFEIELAKQLQISDPVTFALASETLDKFYSFGKRIEALRKEAVKPLNEAKQKIQDEFKPVQEQVDQVLTMLKRKVAEYQQEQDRIAAEKQRIADEQARKEQEELLRQAEKVKSEREAAEQKAAEGDQIAMAQAAAKAEEEAALVEQAQIVTAAKVASTVEGKKAVNIAYKFTGKVVNKKLLLTWLLENPEFIESWVEIKQAPLNKYIQATSGQAKIPGVMIDKTLDVRKKTKRKSATDNVVEASFSVVG